MITTLLYPSTLQFEAPDFNNISIQDYIPAFNKAIQITKTEIDKIANNTEKATFNNTIEALEYSGISLTRVQGIFFNLLEALSNEQMQQIAEEVSPKLTELALYISLNESLFDRIKLVYNSNEPLSQEQKILLNNTYKNFTRGGALLSKDDKQLYGKWAEELSLLELQFSNNVLEATNAYALHLTNKEDLKGLPDYVIEAAAQTAQEQNKTGWVFTLHAPSLLPFLKFSEHRGLREKIYLEYNKRSIGGKQDNTLIIKQIADLRIKIAQILGYKTYAHYAIENRMAKTPEKVNNFLQDLMHQSLPFAQKEVKEITEFAIIQGFNEPQLQAWDFAFWAEKYGKQMYNLDETMLKPYFQLENCLNAIFNLANKLYDISFQEITNIPVYHKDVKVYNVLDHNKQHLALFYADFFPRESKRGGAWMTEFMGQYSKNGIDHRPSICIVTNFSMPTKSMPSLLTHTELTTLLHEFGHALHGILSKGTYPSMCGTNVARDFVELPSQIMENWAYEKDFLCTFAKHYQTNETIPTEYIDRIIKAKNYLAGYQQVRQLQFGILDMEWHCLSSIFDEDALSFENSILDKFRVIPLADGTGISQCFSHIFSGGYSAGYYSYKWAEVLEADAFYLFKQKGIFNKEVAKSFQDNILEKGSSNYEDILYKNFRGQDPDPKALMVSLGLTK